MRFLNLKYVFLSLSTFIASGAYGQIIMSESAWDALEAHDLRSLHSIYQQASKQQKSVIENALYSSIINLDDLSYEQLKRGLTGADDGFNAILNRHILDKENEIIKEITKYSAEELIEYNRKYPGRKELVDMYLTSVVKPNADQISYKELSYLNRKLPALGLESNVQARSQEKAGMIREEVATYCKFEKEHTEILKQLVAVACGQYMSSNYKKLAKEYSKIGIVPDNGAEIEKQYRSVVAQCLRTKELQSHIKKMVDKYCAAINSARAEYAKEANITGYPVMSIQVPEMKSFSFKLGNDLLNKIPTARKDFVESRQTVGTIASVAGSLFNLGWVTTAIGKGLYDMYAVGELADKEINARKDIMSKSYQQMNNALNVYINNLKGSIANQIDANNKKFIEYVSKK